MELFVGLSWIGVRVGFELEMCELEMFRCRWIVVVGRLAGRRELPPKFIYTQPVDVKRTIEKSYP